MPFGTLYWPSKKVNLMIINAYIFDGICDFHERFLFSFYGGFIYMLQ